MKYSKSRSWELMLMAFILFSVSVTACKQKTTGTEEAGANTVVDARTGSLVVEGIFVSHGDSGDELSGQHPATIRDPIHVRIGTAGKPDGSELNVKLFELASGKTVGEQGKHIEADTPMVTEWTFEPGQEWDPGSYLIEVTLNGEVMGHRELEIHPGPVSSDDGGV
ncbi:MAG: hypothetical protein LBL59_07200 [Xanthomonadaceae bacterium]|jgi:hypothetical protein|nr:hypothetical protein [Xanthomonadaceae bacterium]